MPTVQAKQQESDLTGVNLQLLLKLVMSPHQAQITARQLEIK